MALFNLPPQLRVFNRRERNIIPPKYEGVTMPVEFACRIGGTDYFKFTEVANIPPVRALTSAAFFEEANMRCSREYLEKHSQAIDVLLDADKVDRYKIKSLN